MNKITRYFWGAALVLLPAVLSAEASKQAVTLRVSVADARGVPVAGAEVVCTEETYSLAVGGAVAQVLGPIRTTDAHGQAVLDAALSDHYAVRVVARKAGLALGWETPGYLAAGNAEVCLSIVLEEPGALAGRVVDEAGKPVAGAEVRAVPQTSVLPWLDQRQILEPQSWLTAQTDGEGRFRFNCFAPDVNMHLYVKTPRWSSIYHHTLHYLTACGYEVGRTDIRLVLPHEVKVQGRVLDAATQQPVGSVNLAIRPEDGRTCAYPYVAPNVTSTADGRFCFAGVPEGKHRIVLIPSETQTPEWVGRTITIDIAGSPTDDGVTFIAEKGGLIEVAVRDSQTRQPLHGMKASAYGEGILATGRTDEIGTVRLRALPGDCRVSAYGPGYLRQRAEQTVPVVNDKTVKAELLLDPPAPVTGLVCDPSGKPLSGAVVRAWDDEILTDDAGRFTTASADGTEDKAVVVRHLGRNLALISKVAGGSGTFTLEPGVTLAGRVTDPNHVPIPVARIVVRAEFAGGSWDCCPILLTDGQGCFAVPALPEPKDFRYRLLVYAAGYGPATYDPPSPGAPQGGRMDVGSIVLPPANRSIWGTVVDRDGRPVARAPIFLHGSGQPDRNAATDPNGRFAIRRVTDGGVELQACFDDDPRGGAGFLRARGGDENLKIVLGRTSYHQRQTPSLVGKPLPDLQSLGLDPQAAGNHRLLLCFWDMQQRASRRCLSELAAKAAALGTKDVAVFAVDTSGSAEATLRGWASQQKIPFPLVTPRVDAKKVQETWGIRSLPWLILVDEKHVVRAEGFGVDELGQRVQEVTR